MAKLACTCGHVISDQAGSLPFKSHAFADQDTDHLFDQTAELIARYAAMADDERREWVAGHFGSRYPADLPLEPVVMDLVTSTVHHLTWHVYECEGCGTLWIQRTPDDQRFQPYTPAPGNERGILRSVRQRMDAADGTSPRHTEAGVHPRPAPVSGHARPDAAPAAGAGLRGGSLRAGGGVRARLRGRQPARDAGGDPPRRREAGVDARHVAPDPGRLRADGADDRPSMIDRLRRFYPLMPLSR